jgi:cleavage and polyadenylation specificity factor subunit 2
MLICFYSCLDSFADPTTQFEDNEVGFVTGRVVTHASSTIPTLEPVITPSLPPDASVPKPQLRGRVLGSRPPVTLPHSTMIGELKLTALKARLASIGVQAELIGEGVLICGAVTAGNANPETLEESVAVRKTAKGRVELEGNVSDVYYTVRKEIYKLHAFVAA